jgi:hypothetical protein
VVSPDWVVVRLDCWDSPVATPVAAEWLDQVSENPAVLSCKGSRKLDASMASSDSACCITQQQFQSSYMGSTVPVTTSRWPLYLRALVWPSNR